MKRRQLLFAAAAIPAVAAIPHLSLDPLDQLARELPNQASWRRLGEIAWQRQLVSASDIDSLRCSLAAGQGPRLGDHYKKLCSADFGADRVQIVNGWVLSHSEIVLAASIVANGDAGDRA